jgi:hypothetical protein
MALREPIDSLIVLFCKEPLRETLMAAKKKAKTKKTTRGRAQDRARVAGGQEYEVAYQAKKTNKAASAVRKAIKKVGNDRKKVTKSLRGR